MVMVWALVSFTLGWSTTLATFPTHEACEAARATYMDHGSFLTKYECIQVAGARQ